MGDKEIIYLRISSRNEIADIMEKLKNEGVECRSIFQKNEIKTKNVTIRYIIIPDWEQQKYHVGGVHAVGCFGFDERTTDYITRGNNVCEGYALEKYVKDISEMGN